MAQSNFIAADINDTPIVDDAAEQEALDRKAEQQLAEALAQEQRAVNGDPEPAE